MKFFDEFRKGFITVICNNEEDFVFLKRELFQYDSEITLDGQRLNTSVFTETDIPYPIGFILDDTELSYAREGLLSRRDFLRIPYAVVKSQLEFEETDEDNNYKKFIGANCVVEISTKEKAIIGDGVLYFLSEREPELLHNYKEDLTNAVTELQINKIWNYPELKTNYLSLITEVEPTWTRD